MNISHTNYLRSVVLHLSNFYRTLFDTISDGDLIDTSTLCKRPLYLCLPLYLALSSLSPQFTSIYLSNSTPHYLTRYPLSNLSLYLAYSPLPPLNSNDHRHSRDGRSHLGGTRK
jgi:hypothetical protein